MNPVSIHVFELEGSVAEGVADRLADAGHTVGGPESVTAAALHEAVDAVSGADLVVVVGGCGPRGAFGALAAASQVLPGFGERLRAQATPIVALALTSELCVRADRLVVGLPHDLGLAHAAVDLLVPALPELFGGTLVSTPPSKTAAQKAPAAKEATETPAPKAESETRPTKAAPPVGSLGLTSSEPKVEQAAVVDAEVEEIAPVRGWRAAVNTFGGEVILGRPEELPEPVENFAPLVNLLLSAGEFGTLKLPSGRRYGLYGWPDLQRDGSKVLAVGWGDPLCEVVALHRHPAAVGTSIVGEHGLLPSSEHDVASWSEQVTGRVPTNTEGSLFASDTSAVWILQNGRAMKWENGRLTDDGSPKQVLATLSLRWSSR